MRSIIVLFCFSFITTVSFSQVKTNFTNQNYTKFLNQGCIPKDIKNEGHILIVKSPFKEKEKKENLAINEIFETYYKGKFVVTAEDSKDNYSGVYDDNKIYRYTVSVLTTFVENGGIQRKHYELSIIDNLKFLKNLSPKIIRDSMQKSAGDKKPGPEDYKKFIDQTAICDTGLEDAHKKLNDMLAFLAEKLGESK